MLTPQFLNQTVKKLERFLETLNRRLFVPVGETEALGLYETREPLHAMPEDVPYAAPGARWGGEGVYGWFRFGYTVPPELDGQALYLMPRLGFYEATLWVNGRIHSNYAAKEVEHSHGNHWCNRLTAAARAGERFDLALECYAWHDVPGTHPFAEEGRGDFTWPTGGCAVCVQDRQITDAYFDLKTLLSLRAALPESSLRRAEVENALWEAHLRLIYDPDTVSGEAFRNALAEAEAPLRRELEKHGGDGGGFIGLIGHSHMDTAWLWPITETEKKCARTWAGQLNLMEEYPEYLFVQSSALHADWLRRDYPELFERLRQRVKEGRWEPNGGVWVECDCNLTGGEYLIRQFVWGQRFTREQFGYTSDCFWLPDTFGYSSAIPQIMLGCGVKYFLTTKMSWNDTNRFPLTTFLWQGIDGSRVLTHLNRTHQGPSPEMYRAITEGREAIQEPRTAPMRLFSFGKGDGGGGPEFEMLEMARRLGDLSGLPRSGYTTVSAFMHRLEETVTEPSVWADELYLELHRGTLTNQHQIKRNNRLLETALHGLELAIAHRAALEGRAPDGTPVRPLMNTLLTHQFHDLLPGTCIHSAHQEALESMSAAIREADRLTVEALRAGAPGAAPALYNPLSFEREDTLHLRGEKRNIAGARTQAYADMDGQPMTAVSGLRLPAFGSAPLTEGAPENAPSPFAYTGDALETPFASVRFDANGAIASLVDRGTGRELVAGLPFNTFLLAEDVPALWDNWDIDADTLAKFRPAGRLIRRELVSDGPVEMRIRSVWQLTERSTVTQDMVFDAHSPLIRFDTRMDWQEEHRFLKAAFDTALITDSVRCEIQFGHIRRSTHRSTSAEKARFEVSMQRYADLSEHNFGIALFTEGKYGLSVSEGSLRLSLHKGGMRPDRAGDKGLHECSYAILPHACGFSALSVVRPAACFCAPPLAASGSWPSLCSVDRDNVLIETVKPCEDTQNAFILRLYEAAGGCASATLSFSLPFKALWECDMLESPLRKLTSPTLTFTPFRIRTVKVEF